MTSQQKPIGAGRAPVVVRQYLRRRKGKQESVRRHIRRPSTQLKLPL